MRTPRHLRRSLLLLPLLGAACANKVETTLDEALRDRVQTMSDCFPDLFDEVLALVDATEPWHLQASPPVADPSGLSWSQLGDGSLDIDYDVAGSHFDIVVKFYSDAGVEQTDLVLSGASSLTQALLLAATGLHNRFGTAQSFTVASWQLSGGATGSGALTGLLGTGNTVDELRTTSATPSGGPPPVAPGTVTVSSCTLSFTTSSLQIDSSASQTYPTGSIAFSVTGPATTVNGVVTFDGTSTATIVVDDVPGTYHLDLDGGGLTHTS